MEYVFYLPSPLEGPALQFVLKVGEFFGENLERSGGAGDKKNDFLLYCFNGRFITITLVTALMSHIQDFTSH